MTTRSTAEQFSAFAPHVPTLSTALVEAAWGDWVDPREQYNDVEGWGTRGGLATGRIEDRDYGQNRPIFISERDLDDIRAAARVLLDTSGHAIGALRNLTNYIIGTGFTYTAAAHKKRGGTPEMVAAVQSVIDEFMDLNDWTGDLERELFRRSRRDGEFFLGLWEPEAGYLVTRVIEPEQVQEPIGLPAYERSYTFGVDTAADDLERIHGYWVRWNNLEEHDYLTGCQVEHTKLNVDRKIKRGLSDFFAVDLDLQAVRKLLRNTVKGAAIQAAIPFIREHGAGIGKTDVEGMRTANAQSRTTQTNQTGTLRTRYGADYKAGTVLDVAAGQKYIGSPLASGEAANAYIAVLQAGLRSIGCRWSMPEYMISGDASNGNYASSLVAESPFVKNCEAEQSFYERRFLRVFWRVVEAACKAGRIPVAYEVVKRLIEIKVGLPPVATRNKLEETTRSKLLVDMGAKSVKTVAAEEGLDYEQEVEDGAKPVAPPGMSGGFGGPEAGGGGIAGSDAGGPDGGDPSKPADPNTPAAPSSPTGEYMGLSRQQWVRNRKAIADILGEVATGETSVAVAKVFLGGLGLSAASVAGLLADAGDGKVDTELPESAAELVARLVESFNPDQARGDDGKWVSDGDVSAAKLDPAKAKALRDKVTDPEQRKKLDKQLGPQQKTDGQRERGTTAITKGRFRVASPRSKLNVDQANSMMAERGYKTVGQPQYDAAAKAVYYTIQKEGQEPMKVTAKAIGKFLTRDTDVFESADLQDTDDGAVLLIESTADDTPPTAADLWLSRVMEKAWGVE